MPLQKAVNAGHHPASPKDAQREMARQEQELASTPLPGEVARRDDSDQPREVRDSVAPVPLPESADFSTAPTEQVSAEASVVPSTADMAVTGADGEAAAASAVPSNVVAMTARAQRSAATGAAPSSESVEAANAQAQTAGDDEALVSSAPGVPSEADEGTARETAGNTAGDPAGHPEGTIPESGSGATIAPTPETPEASDVPAPAARASRPRKRATSAGRDKATTTPTRPDATAASAASTLLSGLELTVPERPPANVARVKASKRGKRDVNYSWPKVDYALMQEAWKECKPVYSRFWRREDPGGSYRLGFSAFVAKAMLVAFEDVDAWVGTIRNDGRLEPVPGGRQQVGLVWPVEVENQVIDLWETLDRAKFPADFSLTKQHLAAAAILHGLNSVSQWLLEADNDDRFSVPVEADGRLRVNRPDSDSVTV